MMRDEVIRKAEQFMRNELMKAVNYKNQTRRTVEYRIEHSFRVAHTASEIAQAEGLDQERMYVAALLHDIGYSKDYKTREEGLNHGRVGAEIARPFLLDLGYSGRETNEMCYGIAIHVDDKADFDGERTPFTLTIQDADNIDRFDVYRLYTGLSDADFEKWPVSEQKAYVEKRIQVMTGLIGEPFGTVTATKMWQEKIGFQIEFFRRLQNQLSMSDARIG